MCVSSTHSVWGGREWGKNNEETSEISVYSTTVGIAELNSDIRHAG